jgi:hypothetical protein
MATRTATYDAGRVVITFGPHVLTGYADGTFVKASRDEDTFKKRVGADGFGTRIRMRNKGGSVELTLEQTSPSNDFLAATLLSDELLGTGVMPLVVKDLGGTTVAAAGEAWIRKPADIEGAKEAGTRTWILDTCDLAIFPGGNAL